MAGLQSASREHRNVRTPERVPSVIRGLEHTASAPRSPARESTFLHEPARLAWATNLAGARARPGVPAYQLGMAKGQHLSAYQQKIVGRHYEHFDTKIAVRLQELLTELFLASKMAAGDAAGQKALDKLWKKAEENLAKAKVEPAVIAKIMQERRVEKLGELVNKITAPAK